MVSLLAPAGAQATQLPSTLLPASASGTRKGASLELCTGLPAADKTMMGNVEKLLPVTAERQPTGTGAWRLSTRCSGMQSLGASTSALHPTGLGGWRTCPLWQGIVMERNQSFQNEEFIQFRCAGGRAQAGTLKCLLLSLPTCQCGRED